MATSFFNFPAEKLENIDDIVQQILAKEKEPRENVADELSLEMETEVLLEEREKLFTLAKKKNGGRAEEGRKPR
jgi:hypothetical protein